MTNTFKPKLLGNFIFNTKTKEFQPWADWALEACDDPEIKMTQDIVSPWIGGESCNK